MPDLNFVIRVRFAPGTSEQLNKSLPDEVYIGEDGRWSTRDEARRFASRMEAEVALDLKWNQLRTSGSTHMMNVVCVETVPETVD